MWHEIRGGDKNPRVPNPRVYILVKMEVFPTDVFPYVHAFLLQNKLTKTAKCFRKEAGWVRRSDLVFI
jgi:hypothetical protein